jgi:hypothetical protein
LNIRNSFSLALMSLLVVYFLEQAIARTVVAHSSEEVNFSENVAPIFFNKCVSCHRPGEAAPMSLLTYRDARPWAKSIREKVANRTMPPWHADPAYGKFHNDRRLSPKEVDTIVAWVDNGALEGDPRRMPTPPSFTDGWRIGKPDVVLSMPSKFEVPAEGVLDYKYFTIPTCFLEDRWIKAVEVRPGNRAVVHHVIVFVAAPGIKRQMQADDRSEDGLESIGGFAPGNDPVVLPEDVGIKIRAGSSLILQMHYTPNGTVQTDQTSVGLIFNKTPVRKTMMGGAALNSSFAIPPNDPNYEVKAKLSFDEDSHITSLMPHMHVRGKDFVFRLVSPDGKTTTILSVPKYDFNWQTRYEFAESIAVPKGSSIECVAHFDNSIGNKWNPDHTKLVYWGPQTFDEMMIGFVDYTLDREPARTSVDVAATRKESVQSPARKEAGSTLNLPSVDAVLEKYVKAIGGVAAIQSKTSRIFKGTFKVPAYNADGQLVIYTKSPNKELTETSSGMLGSSKTGFNGITPWQEEDGNPSDLPSFAKRDADFYLPIKLKELYPNIKVIERTKINEREVVVLTAPRGGRPKSWFFDTQSGLLTRIEIRTSQGALIRQESYDDYRSVDGVMIAFSIDEIDEDGTEIVTKITEVQHNIPIDDAKFEKPAGRSKNKIN